MKLRRFLTRHMPGFRFDFIPRVPGARTATITRIGDTALRPYRGPYDQHVLLVVHLGSMLLEAHGGRAEAGAGDAMLIGRGEAGHLTFLPCPNAESMVIEIITFDERAIARHLRNSEVWEDLALDEWMEAPAAITLRGFSAPPAPNPKNLNHRFHALIGELLGTYRSGLSDFLRHHFYQSRWMLCVFLEQFVISADGARRAAEQYPSGAAQFRRDCLLYLGHTPAAILIRRRCELATAWMRCGHSIEKVAQALNFDSRWEFEYAYSGFTKKRCREVQGRIPLAEAEPEELIRAMQPFWWSDNRKFSVERPHPARMFKPDVMSEAEESAHIAADPKLQEQAQDNRKQRATVAGDWRNRAADFLAMKSTGAEAIIPIFRYAKPEAVAA